MKNSQKGFIGIALLVILGLLIVGGGAYYVGTKHMAEVANNASSTSEYGNDLQLNTSANVTTQNGTSTTTSDTSSWKTYSNSQYGFSFKYPADIFLEPRIDIDSANPNYPTLRMEYRGVSMEEWQKDGMKGQYKEGLKINIQKGDESEYKYYESLYQKESLVYKKVVLDNQQGYEDVNTVPNELFLFKLKDQWIINFIDMAVYVDGCKTNLPECGFNQVKDDQNEKLFNSILSTFKFTN